MPQDATRAPGLLDDAGDIILGWLTRIVVWIAVIGVVIFDALSIGVGHISAADDADSAALAASHAWHDTHSREAALEAARRVADDHDETVVEGSLFIADDGSVRLRVQHNVTTVVVRHVHGLRAWAHITEGGSGRYVA